MQPKFYDPLGRECSAEAFSEWCERIDLKTVRQFRNDKFSVKLLWNDVPHVDFCEPKVFKLDIRYFNGAEWVLSPGHGEDTFSRLSSAIEGYQACLIDNGCGVRSAAGIFVEGDNKLPATIHELEFDLNDIDSAEAEIDTSIEFEMPKLSPVEAVIERPKVDHVGASLGCFEDGSEAW